MTDIAKNPKDLEPVRLDAHCEWNVNALNEALWAAHSQSEETGADYKSVCNVLADLHHVLATAPTPLVMLRRAATAVLNTLPTEEECRDVALWGQFEIAREVAERVRAECDLLYALAQDSVGLLAEEVAECDEPTATLQDTGEPSAGLDNSPQSKEPEDDNGGERPGGRPPKWDHAVKFVEKYKQTNKHASDEDALANYRQTYSRRLHPTTKQLQDARSYRSNRKH